MLFLLFLLFLIIIISFIVATTMVIKRHFMVSVIAFILCMAFSVVSYEIFANVNDTKNENKRVSKKTTTENKVTESVENEIVKKSPIIKTNTFNTRIIHSQTTFKINNTQKPIFSKNQTKSPKETLNITNTKLLVDLSPIRYENMDESLYYRVNGNIYDYNNNMYENVLLIQMNSQDEFFDSVSEEKNNYQSIIYRNQSPYKSINGKVILVKSINSNDLKIKNNLGYKQLEYFDFIFEVLKNDKCIYKEKFQKNKTLFDFKINLLEKDEFGFKIAVYRNKYTEQEDASLFYFGIVDSILE